MTHYFFRRPQHPSRVRLVWAAGLLALAWLAGLLWFVFAIPDRVADETTRTDAIVVLTGGAGRLDEGFALLRRHMAKKLLVSGVYRGIDAAELLRQTGQKDDDLLCCIVLDHMADNTLGNAVETAAWMRTEGFTSLRLVTGNYHMRRSLLEFRRAMPTVVIIPHPVFPDTVKRSNWLTSPAASHLVISEYMKYLAVSLRLGGEAQ